MGKKISSWQKLDLLEQTVKAEQEKWKLCCFGRKGNANKPMSYADWVCAGFIAVLVISFVLTIMSYAKPS